jgi:hypothetical protein
MRNAPRGITPPVATLLQLEKARFSSIEVPILPRLKRTVVDLQSISKGPPSVYSAGGMASKFEVPQGVALDREVEDTHSPVLGVLALE